jgi:hypothetical protein
VSKINEIIKERTKNLSPNLAKASVDLMEITSGAEDIIKRACRTCDFETDEETLSATYKFDT